MRDGTAGGPRASSAAYSPYRGSGRTATFEGEGSEFAICSIGDTMFAFFDFTFLGRLGRFFVSVLFRGLDTPVESVFVNVGTDDVSMGTISSGACANGVVTGGSKGFVSLEWSLELADSSSCISALRMGDTTA